MVKLYDILNTKTEIQQAKEVLDQIEKKINLLKNEGDSESYLVIGPKNWYISFFYPLEKEDLGYYYGKKNLPSQCDVSKQTCICICEGAYKENCDSSGICKDFSEYIRHYILKKYTRPAPPKIYKPGEFLVFDEADLIFLSSGTAPFPATFYFEKLSGKIGFYYKKDYGTLSSEDKLKKLNLLNEFLLRDIIVKNSEGNEETLKIRDALIEFGWTENVERRNELGDKISQSAKEFFKEKDYPSGLTLVTETPYADRYDEYKYVDRYVYIWDNKDNSQFWSVDVDIENKGEKGRLILSPLLIE